MPIEGNNPMPHKRPPGDVDSRKVFVIYGRNERLRKGIFDLLRAGGLDPKEWGAIMRETRQGSPYNLHVVTKGLSTAVAVVALWSGDDLVRLRPDLKGKDEPDEPVERQPRPNVILETGLALAMKPKKVVIVCVGSLRKVSDLEGINYVTIQDVGGKKDAKGRKDLLDRLKDIGAAVDIEGKNDWMTTGDFMDENIPSTDRPALDGLKSESSATSEAVRILENEIMTYGFIGRNTALRKIVIQNRSNRDIWRIHLKASYFTHEGEIGSRSFSLGAESDRPPLLPAGKTVTFEFVTKRARKGRREPGVRLFNAGLTNIKGQATKVVLEIEGYEEIKI